MLGDLIQALLDAKTEQEKERAYRNLERVGMDRMTAEKIIEEFKK